MLAAAIAASLRVGFGSGSEATVQVVDDQSVGYRLKIDCVTRCTRPLHYAQAIGNAPMGLVDLDQNGLVYSVWGTGCCYVVRIWQVTVGGVTRVLETGSRGVPSVITNPSLAVVTYMPPTDASGRETSRLAKPVRWTYRHGRFVRS